MTRKIFEKLRASRYYQAKNGGLLNLSAVACFVIVLIENPIVLYEIAPQEMFGVTFQAISTAFALYFFCAVLAVYLLSKIVNSQLLFVFTSIFVFLAIATFVYSRGLGLDGIKFSNFQIQNHGTILSEMWQIFIEAYLLVILFIASFEISLRSPLFLHKVMVCILIVSMSQILSASEGLLFPEDRPVYEYENADNFHIELARNKQNVLIFVLDGFSGGILHKIRTEAPHILSTYTDFIWHKNTLTTNSGTLGTLPALISGHKYTPDQIIKAGDTRPIDEILDAAFEDVPKQFHDAGYKVSFVNPMFKPRIHPDFYAYEASNKEPLLDKDAMDAFVSKTLLMLSVFRSSPMFSKPTIYDKGNWLIHDVNVPLYEQKISHMELLRRLASEQIVTTDEARYSGIHFLVPHSPSVITRSGTLDFKGNGRYIPESAYALEQMGNIITRIREAGDDVYNNTHIVIASDHGSWIYNPLFDESFSTRVGYGHEERLNPGFVHALLMEKPVGRSSAKMQVSNLLMSNADIASLVCKGKVACKDVDPTATVANRVRTLNIVDLNIWPYRGTFQDYLKEQWTVQNSIFDANNWEKQEIP